MPRIANTDGYQDATLGWFAAYFSARSCASGTGSADRQVARAVSSQPSKPAWTGPYGETGLLENKNTQDMDGPVVKDGDHFIAVAV
jgi:hypothetical protein